MKNLQNVTTTDCVIHFGGLGKGQKRENYDELDPVGSTVRYEMMKLCTGSV